MFLSRVQISSYPVESIQLGSFRVRIYSDQFLSVPVLSGKRNLDPKSIYKFSVRLWSKYFWLGSRSGFRIQVKMPRPSH